VLARRERAAKPAKTEPAPADSAPSEAVDPSPEAHADASAPTFALDDVIEAWPATLAILKAPLRAGIQDAQPIALENGIIVFGVPKVRYDAINERFRKEAAAIKDAFAQRLGAAPRFMLRPHDFGAPGALRPDAVETGAELFADLFDRRPDLDHGDDLRGHVADDEIDALAAEAAHPLGVGIALGHIEKARDRHLGQDHVAGQGELERAEGESLRRAQDACHFRRPGGQRVEALGGHLGPLGIAGAASQPPDERQRAGQREHGDQVWIHQCGFVQAAQEPEPEPEPEDEDVDLTELDDAPDAPPQPDSVTRLVAGLGAEVIDERKRG